MAGSLRSALEQVRIEGKPDIQEIHVVGDYAFCWNQLSLTLIPLQGGSTQRRAGPTLSVFRKEPDGRGILFRDANMLSATRMQRLCNYRTERHDTSLFPATRMPRLPAIGDEIGECSGFTN